MKKYDTFLLDADDTILDFHAASEAALESAVKSYGKEWNERYAKVFFTFNDSLWQKLERKELTREKLLNERFPAYLSMLGFNGIDGEEFNQKYLSYLATHPVYMEGAEEFLKRLSASGRIYIVTNGTYQIQKSRFEICGLVQYVRDVFVSEKIGCDKPGKVFTDYAIRHIPSFSRDNTVWIGDSITADIFAANAAEIHSIWLNPKNKPTEGKAFPDYQAHSYAEILHILQIE